ncbi:MAG: glycosidase [Verrucomicrobiaceae bacterium]|nr:MAG: glycosidase [Verrucomicrobiaceae bacterium]
MNAIPANDRIIFEPRDVDLSQSPLRGSLDEETFVLGAFNPALTVLPSGNLLMMVRVAEALAEPVRDGIARALRWDPDRGYVTDAYELSKVDASDPRELRFLNRPSRVVALTSLSWLLPVELSPSGGRIERIHYDKIISPSATSQEYGIEDARISRVDGMYHMTVCAASAERHSTQLYSSTDGLSYVNRGVVLDHQNKDMLIFEGLVGGKFHALTRPMGMLYFSYPPGSPYEAGPSINLASSPDCLHWKPDDKPFIRPLRNSGCAVKVGGGTPPVLTPAGWLMLYHGVEEGATVGTYRTFWALLDRDDPAIVLENHNEVPVLESLPELTEHLGNQLYLEGVVFTTGIVDAGEDYLVASGENDIACRLTRISKKTFLTKTSP